MNLRVYRSSLLAAIVGSASLALSTPACERPARPKPCGEMTSLEECQMAAHCVDIMDNVKDGWDGMAWHCHDRGKPVR